MAFKILMLKVQGGRNEAGVAAEASFAAKISSSSKVCGAIKAI